MPVHSSFAQLVERDSGVDPDYRHGPKHVTPGLTLETPRATFKWYDLHREDLRIPESIVAMARKCIMSTQLEVPGLGFVILHRCGNDFYFLIASTWRNENELWTTVFYKDGDRMAEFALFPRDGTHKPCFCVWEMVPVWHETQAWTRFLGTTRDAGAAEAWREDRFGGTA
jgi:hypothetical protein